MVKLKKRYLLVEMISDDNIQSNLNTTDLYHTLVDQVGRLFGDCGIGTVKCSLQIKVCDENTNIAVIKTSADAVYLISSSLPFIRQTDNTRTFTPNLIYIGASMRTVERFLVEQNLKTLYERLRSAKSPVERSNIQQLICSVTGSKVAHIDF